MIKPQTLKGFRDFLPKEARKRQYVVNTLKNVFELYGFEPLETPALEYEEILLGKYGEEGDKLMYRFEDLGKRHVALRYDQTVPLARVVAQYQNGLPMPFKRYQIQPVWRAENTQKGRFREFMQCDIDTVNSGSLLSDAEIIACVLMAMKKLGFKDAKMLLNNRTVFRDLLPKYISSIDKLDKIGKEKVIEELARKGLAAEAADQLMTSLMSSKPAEEDLQLIKFLEAMGLKQEKDFVYKPTLARGLDYYTGSIFELIVPRYTAGSLGGGGRYDNLIGLFAGRKIPAVGFAFGFDRIIEAMDELSLFPSEVISSETKVLVTVFNKDLLNYSLRVLNQLQTAGINSEISLDTGQKLDKQFKYADKKGIPYVAIIGPEEVKNDTVTLKNLKSREQKTIPQKDLPDALT